MKLEAEELRPTTKGLTTCKIKSTNQPNSTVIITNYTFTKGQPPVGSPVQYHHILYQDVNCVFGPETLCLKEMFWWRLKHVKNTGPTERHNNLNIRRKNGFHGLISLALKKVIWFRGFTALSLPLHTCLLLNCQIQHLGRQSHTAYD